jgi:hypothetical protein
MRRNCVERSGLAGRFGAARRPMALAHHYSGACRRLKPRDARFELANATAGAGPKAKRNEADNRKCQHHHHRKRDEPFHVRFPRPARRASGRRERDAIRTGRDRGSCYAVAGMAGPDYRSQCLITAAP